MRTAQTAHSPANPYTKQPGMEPIPGYVLLEPLGRGGFGEVWKCEAPGGLHKAVKFVAGSDDVLSGNDVQLRQEYEAFLQIKAIRHPFLLCLERVELAGDELVMVMGLADCQLGDRFTECRKRGLPGVPRAELLGYLREAAEALDYLSTQHGLLHLDVKPANLFLTAGHIQVGDYGLVSKLDCGGQRRKSRGLTPRYAAPEVIDGQLQHQSDQYSLALVYHELLTGTFPFSGRTSQQLMIQHVTEAPDLSGLPERDRGPVGTALAKAPDQRFPSCREFIDALANARPPSAAPALKGLVSPARPSLAPQNPPAKPLSTPALRSPSEVSLSGGSTRARANAGESTQANPLAVPVPVPPSRVTPPPRASDAPHPQPGVCLDPILSVMPVERLRGRPAPEPDLPPPDMVRALVAAADGEMAPPADPSAVTRLPDGTWECRFLTTLDPRIAKVKLDVLWERGGVIMDCREDNRVIFRRLSVAAQPASVRLFGKKPPPQPESGFEVVVDLPQPGLPVGGVVATGRVFGTPSPEFARLAPEVVVSLIEDARRELNNAPERRQHPRVRAGFPVTLFPIHSNGRVEPPLSGRCRDVSAGGLALSLAAKPPTKYVYVTFDGVRGTAGLALLLQLLRVERAPDGVLAGGRFRLDLPPPTTA